MEEGESGGWEEEGGGGDGDDGDGVEGRGKEGDVWRCSILNADGTRAGKTITTFIPSQKICK